MGSTPPELTRSASLSPVAVTRNELTVLSPALTANRRRPSGVRFTEPEPSTVGKPNGGVAAMPRPPVWTRSGKESLPSRLCLNTSTAFAFVLVSV